MQVVRNGEIVEAWDLRSQQAREWSGQFELGDTAFAWYAIRLTATCADPACLAAWRQPAEIYEVAVADPVYFLPVGFRRPQPTPATVTLKVSDELGQPVAATVCVTDAGREVARRAVGPSGRLAFQAPATARLTITAAGYRDASKDLYLDSPVFAFCRDFTGFYSPEGYHRLRALLGQLEFDVKLTKIEGRIR